VGGAYAMVGDWITLEPGVQSHDFTAEISNLKIDPQQKVNLYDQYSEKAEEMNR
jgi:hypothetical protein